MRRQVAASFILLAGVLAGISFLPAPAAGQSGGQKAGAIPRMSNGKPDFTGVYAGPGFQHLKTANDTDEAGVAIFSTKNMAPFKPGGEALFFEKDTGVVSHDDATALCLPDGFPREAMSPYATQIISAPGYVVIVYEYEHFTRVIPTDGRPHPKNVDLTWMGDSVGRWDGDTLVVDTIGLKAWQMDAFHGKDARFKAEAHAGQGVVRRHSDALHVIERFTRTDPQTIAYQMTIDDPLIFTRPWSQDFVMKLHPTWDKVLEQICEENNRCEAGHCPATNQ
jgi:hypothetical protein